MDRPPYAKAEGLSSTEILNELTLFGRYKKSETVRPQYSTSTKNTIITNTYLWGVIQSFKDCTQGKNS